MAETDPLLSRASSNPPHKVDDESIASRWNAFRGSQKFKLLVVATALFTDNFLYGAVIPSLPYDLPSRADVPPDEVEFWISSFLATYGLANLLAAPVLSFLALRTRNRKGPLLFGLVLLCGATLIYGFGRDVRALIAARALQGVSAAIVYTSGLAFLADSVPSESMGSYMGIALSAENAGLMISPLIGGPVYARLGRGALVGLMLILIALDIALRLSVAETPGQVPALESISNIDSASEGDDAIDSTQSYRSEAQDDEDQTKRVTALSLMKNPRIVSAAYGLFLGQFLLSIFDSVLPRFTQRTYGWESTGAGLIFLTLSLPSLASALAGALSDKYGPKWVTFAGFTGATPALAALALAEKDDRAHEVLLCVVLAIIGLAVAFITTPLAADLALVAEKETDDCGGKWRGDDGYAQVFSILLFAQCSGILLGPIWGGFAYKQLGWTVLSTSLAAISATALLPSLFFIGGRLFKRRK